MKANNNYHSTGSKVITSTEDNENVNRFFNDVKQYIPLTKEEEKNLIKAIQKNKDQAALDKLIKANIRFVITVAKTYQNQGVPLLDLIQEGASGMVEAAYRFDIKRDLRFYSYAVWWIKNKIITTFDLHKRLVQMPANRTLLVTKVKRVMVELESKLERPCTVDEVKKHFEDQSVQDIEEAISFSLLPISLFAHTFQKDGELSDTMLHETFIAPNVLEVDPIDKQNSLEHDLNKLLYQLPQQQYDVIVLSLGLNQESSHRNEQLAEIFGKRDKDIIAIKKQGIALLKKFKDQTDINTYL